MLRSNARLLWIPVALSLVLSGCGAGTSQPAASQPSKETVAAPAQPAPAVAELPKLELITAKVGGTDRLSLKHLPIFLKPFGEAEAVSVDFKEYTSGTRATQGLLAKETDFGFLQAEHVLRDTSGELRIIALITRYPGSGLIVSADYKDKIKSVKDLEGKSVGVSSMGAASHQFLLTLLSKNGIEAKNVNVLPVGLNAPEVLPQGKVVAMVTIEPFITQAVESGQAFVVVDARRAEGTQAVYGADQWPWIAVVTRADVIESNPQLVERFTKAVTRNLGVLASTDVDDLVAMTPADMFPNNDKALFQQILKANRAQFSPDGRLNRQLFDPVWANMQALGAVPKDQPFVFEKVIEPRFANSR